MYKEKAACESALLWAFCCVGLWKAGCLDSTLMSVCLDVSSNLKEIYMLWYKPNPQPQTSNSAIQSQFTPNKSQ